MNKAAKCEFPGISDDQAEGCHILSLSHLGKIHFQQSVLPVIISILYIMRRNLKMQSSSLGSLQGCAGQLQACPPQVLDEFLSLHSLQKWAEEMSSTFLLCHIYDLGVQLNLVSYLCIWNYKRRQGFVVFVNIYWLRKCVWQLLPPKLCWNFRFCLYCMHFNRLWISGMTEPRSQTSNWNTLISWHLKHTNLHFEWGYLQQNRYYLLAFSSTSHGSVTYPLIANGLPNKRAGSSAPEVIQQATGRLMQYICLLVSCH